MIKSPVTVFFRGVNRDDDGVHVGIAGDVVDVCSIPKRWVVRSLEDSPDKSVAVVHFVVVQWVFTGENESLSSCRIRT